MERLKGPVNKDPVNFALKTSDAFVEGRVCPPYKQQRVCLPFRKLFSRTLAALEILKIQTNNEPGHIIYESKMKLGRTVTDITKLKDTSFMMWHL